jgi:cytochrome c biogenesis protein CcdA/thiol-disulfide isomerase/thioredoxin
VLVLLGIGFLAGLITALSPCVLPVLPIVLAGGASGGRRRPYAIVAGLVASFTVFTLSAAAALKALGLPRDLLRNLAIALLFVVAATLLSTRVAHLVERPFYALTRFRPGDAGGGFLLGVGLGLVFVPCAGPVLAAVTVLAANREVGVETVALTLAYALGAAVPLLAVALGGRRVSAPLRARMPWLRPALGGIVAASALAIALGEDRRFQTMVPGYTEAFQERVERSGAADRELLRLTGAHGPGAESESALADYGEAPEFERTGAWLNSPALTMDGLRGKVVVIDFWTYSCVNCLRTLPYLRAWDRTYRPDGLVIVGVHTPEFAFEHELSNVRRAVRELGLRYPVVQDNDFGTWNAWGNRYWPAKYFVDRRGHVRFAHFGEGEYERSEEVIRELLAEGGGAPAGSAGAVRADTASGEAGTPETYLGWGRLDADTYAGTPVRPDVLARYRFPERELGLNGLAYEGLWRVESERIVAGEPGARLRLRFRARDVHLVLGGRGEVEVRLDGTRVRRVRVAEDRLYTLLRLPVVRDGLLELRFDRGVEAYAFTFG